MAHLNQIFRWSEYQKINDCADILLVDEERTYTLIENMFKSLRKSFQSEYVHIGMDEAYFFGMGNYAKKLAEYAPKSVNYSYLFEYVSALCNLLSVKYGLGARTREAYQKREKNMLATVAQDYLKAIKLLEMFYDKFWRLWLKENKPYGFDVQDIRLGGLKQRLQACYNRLTAYCNGEIDSISELEQTLLEIPSEYDIVVNHWERMVTPNVI